MDYAIWTERNSSVLYCGCNKVNLLELTPLCIEPLVLRTVLVAACTRRLVNPLAVGSTFCATKSATDSQRVNTGHMIQSCGCNYCTPRDILNFWWTVHDVQCSV